MLENIKCEWGESIWLSVSHLLSLGVVSLQGVGTLQQVQVSIIDQAACQEMFHIQASEQVNIRYDMLCAGFQEGGKDSCQVSVCCLLCV